MTTAKEHRQLLYHAIETLLGRKMEAHESQEISRIVRNYVKDEMNLMRVGLERANRKVKPMGKSIWALLHKAGTPEGELAFLKQATRFDEPDDELTRRLVELLSTPLV